MRSVNLSTHSVNALVVTSDVTVGFDEVFETHNVCGIGRETCHGVYLQAGGAISLIDLNLPSSLLQ